MATEIFIREAPEAEAIALELIPEHHPHLRRARVLYLFTTQKRRKCDKVKLASAAKMSALQRYLSSGTEASVQAGFDFIMLIGNEEWGFLPTEGRRALVDHELSHMGERVRVTKRGDEKRAWSLLGHDVEEFQAVLERHGLWRREVRQFAHAARQLPLDDAPAPEARQPAGVGA